MTKRITGHRTEQECRVYRILAIVSCSVDLVQAGNLACSLVGFKRVILDLNVLESQCLEADMGKSESK